MQVHYRPGSKIIQVRAQIQVRINARVQVHAQGRVREQTSTKNKCTLYAPVQM